MLMLPKSHSYPRSNLLDDYVLKQGNIKWKLFCFLGENGASLDPMGNGLGVGWWALYWGNRVIIKKGDTRPGEKGFGGQ